MTRAAIIAPIVVRHDAISTAVRNLWRILAEPGWDVSVLTTANEYPEMPTRIVPGIAELLLERAFRQADVLIYEFGIYSPLFDALLVGNGLGRQIVRFHNITPPELLGPEAGPLIAKSFAQLHVLSCADRIWAVSEENASVLARHNVGTGRTEVLPLVVDWPPRAALATKPKQTVEALFVGRMVRSKGLADLLEALEPADDIRLTVVGNLRFSDPVYFEECRAVVAARGLGSSIRFLGTVESETLRDLYHRSHILAIPSYHEGFCKPVIEALRSGCVPVGYAGSNLPAITGGLGRLVPEGDIAALGRALRDVAAALRSGAELPLDGGTRTPAGFDAACEAWVQNFAFDRLRATTIARVQALLPS
jgi:glycosyltransferase involved in cell wall biosynthesis